MNVVDSSGWLEYFADGVNAEFFAPAVQNTQELLVPTLSLFEVFKGIAQQRTESDALQAVATMQQGTVLDLTASLALEAARLSLDQGLPMSDSIMLASARSCHATFWTQDSLFEGMDGIRYIRKGE